MANQVSEDGKPVVTIKKYANRRLYNTASSSYVTLDHLAQMVKDGTDFVVFDAKSGDDITRQVLTHIIVEEESKGQNLLPISFLRHLISFYGDSLQGLVPSYLEHSMTSFAHNQEKMREYMSDAMTGLMPFKNFEEMSKQNMAIFENAMKMFSPFGDDGGPEQAGDKTPASENPEAKLDEIRSKLESMQKELNDLTK